ncbi:MAG: dockerin type I repeat-containing protein [Ruminococcus sp.]|nr:dockerin type I repeat-containing protein [Ruminococcus sp.]MDE6784175.1 dockerin type I repeat-containing protein [Ruminococcus sp.]
MKKIKKLSMCVLTAASLVASFVVPIASEAICLVQDSNGSAFDFLNDEERYIKLDGKYKEFCDSLNFYMFDDEQIAKADVYAVKGHASIFKVIPLNGYDFDEICAVFNLTEGTTEEQVNALLSEKFSPDLKIEKYGYNPDYEYKIGNNFKEVCKVLKEENLIDSFVIPGGYFELVEYYTDSGDYMLSYYLSDDEYEMLNEYVTENNIGDLILDERFTNGYSSFYLDTGDLETTEEIFDAAIEIYETVGFYPNYTSPETPDIAQTDSIDVYNAVDGDANCDGELSIADATLILQYLGNSDKYSLSTQGAFNADVIGDYDGVSAADAVAIQMLETGVIDELG